MARGDRLKYALQLMVKNPDMPLNEVAAKSKLSYSYLRKALSLMKKSGTGKALSRDRRAKSSTSKSAKSADSKASTVSSGLSRQVVEVVGEGESVREKALELRKTLPPGLSAGFSNMLLMCWIGDDHVIDVVHGLVEKYLPEPDLLGKARKMRLYYNLAADLVTRLTSDEVKALIYAPSPRAVAVARTLESTLESAVPDLYDAALAEYPDLDVISLGYMVYGKLMSRCYALLAELLLAIYQVMKSAGIGAGYLFFLANRAQQLETGVAVGNKLKLVEERDILHFIAANTLHPQPWNVDDQFKRFLDVSMAAVAVTYASTINPGLAPLQDQLRSLRQAMLNADTVKHRIEWLNMVLQRGISKPLHLLVNPAYLSTSIPGRIVKWRCPLTGKVIPCYDGMPTPLYYVPIQYWKMALGKDEEVPPSLLAEDVALRPVAGKRLGLFGHGKEATIYAFLGPFGSGKTVLLDAFGCFAVDRYNATVFRPSMPRDQHLLSIAPLLPVIQPLRDDYRTLVYLQRLRPKGYLDKAQFITVAEDESQLERRSVYTVCDEVIWVDDLDNFHLPWDRLVKPGFLEFRSLARQDDTDRMRRTLINDFFDWRQYHRDHRILMEVDEMWEIAPSERYGTEARLAHDVIKVIRDLRGLGLPLIYTTTRPLDINDALLQILTGFFFGYLPGTSRGESSKSPRLQMLGIVASALSDQEKAMLTTVQKLMENRPITKNYLLWFIYDQRIHMVRALLPPHCLEAPNTSIQRLLQRLEEATGEKYLRSLDEILEKSASTAKPQPHKARRPRFGEDLIKRMNLL